MRAPLSYDRYTELLSKRILRTITPAEVEDVARFEAAQPKLCPKCNANVHSQFMPAQIVHDIDKCSGNQTNDA